MNEFTSGTLTPVRLLNYTDHLYVVALDENGMDERILAPGESSYPKSKGIKAFVAYRLFSGIFRSVRIIDERQRSSNLWMIPAVGEGNCMTTWDGQRYQLDRPGVSWNELGDGTRLYLKRLLRYEGLTKREMLKLSKSGCDPSSIESIEVDHDSLSRMRNASAF